MMVWLKSPKSQLSKTSCRLKIGWMLRKLWAEMCGCDFCIDSVDVDTIECIRDPFPVSTVSTYMVLMVWLKTPKSQLSKTFCRLKIGWILRKLWAETCGCVLYRGVRGHFIQSRVEFSHLIVLCIGCCVRATNTCVSTVLKNIAFNAFACFDLCINSVDKYTIHNSIALILCIDCLNMPFNVHTTDKVTVSGFLTI